MFAQCKKCSSPSMINISPDATVEQWKEAVANYKCKMCIRKELIAQQIEKMNNAR